MTPEQQVAALKWNRAGGKWWFRGKLGDWPRLIGGESKEALLPIAREMAQGRA